MAALCWQLARAPAGKRRSQHLYCCSYCNWDDKVPLPLLLGRLVWLHWRLLLLLLAVLLTALGGVRCDWLLLVMPAGGTHGSRHLCCWCCALPACEALLLPCVRDPLRVGRSTTPGHDDLRAW